MTQRLRFGSVSIAAVRDRTNSPVDATRGSLVAFVFTHASPLLGSDSGYAFNKADLEIARFHPLSRNTVLAWRVKGGVILPENFSLSGQEARYVPPDQRLYAGGPNTVRGFRLNDLGPRVYVTSDTTNFTVQPNGDTVYATLRASPTGGNTLFLANAELRFPSPVWPQFVRLGLFVDVGQLYQRGEEALSLANFRITPGIGVRVATPLGPVRLDVAYNAYATEQGTLFFADSAGNLVDTQKPYPTFGTAPAKFFDRLVLQLAVGQAF